MPLWLTWHNSSRGRWHHLADLVIYERIASYDAEMNPQNLVVVSAMVQYVLFLVFFLADSIFVMIFIKRSLFLTLDVLVGWRFSSATSWL